MRKPCIIVANLDSARNDIALRTFVCNNNLRDEGQILIISAWVLFSDFKWIELQSNSLEKEMYTIGLIMLWVYATNYEKTKTFH